MKPAPDVRSPRVLHCITKFGLGGAERVAVSLAGELHDRFTFAVHAIQNIRPDPVGKTLQEQLNSHAIPWHLGARAPIKLGGMIAGGLGLARTVRRFQPDVVHLHTEIPESAYAIAVTAHPALRAIPLVRTIHNSRFWHHWKAIGRWAERRLPAAHIVAVSQAALAAYQSHAQCTAITPRSQRIIFNGVTAPATLSSSSRPQNTPLRLLFAGRFDRQKGADLLPEILSRLAATDTPACELTLAGEGDLAPVLYKLPHHAPAGWRVNVIGPIPNLETRLHDFDVVLMPSRFEGLSLLAIETVMRKIPLVATRAPGLREIFPDNYPWLAEPGDAADFTRVLQLFLRSTTTWTDSMDDAQRLALREFRLPRMAAEYATLYQELARDR